MTGTRIRLLTASERRVPVPKLLQVLDRHGYTRAADLERLFGLGEDWGELDLSYLTGAPIAGVRQDFVTPASSGEETIGHLLAAVPALRPLSVRDWLAIQLRQVKVVYSFRWAGGQDDLYGWVAMGLVLEQLRSLVGGLVQGDGEGYYLDAGVHIAWDPALDIQAMTGWRDVAVLREGRWVQFKIDVQDAGHLEAFLSGEVPRGIRL
jgi:hypothetical protein